MTEGHNEISDKVCSHRRDRGDRCRYRRMDRSDRNRVNCGGPWAIIFRGETAEFTKRAGRLARGSLHCMDRRGNQVFCPRSAFRMTDRAEKNPDTVARFAAYLKAEHVDSPEFPVDHAVKKSSE